MKKMIFTLGMALSLVACTWVELTPEGEKVKVATEADVANCKNMGKATVSVKAELGGVVRNQEKVQKELETLARNIAIDLKGDTVVPAGEITDGRQVFNVYRCINTEK